MSRRRTAANQVAPLGAMQSRSVIGVAFFRRARGNASGRTPWRLFSPCLEDRRREDRGPELLVHRWRHWRSEQRLRKQNGTGR